MGKNINVILATILVFLVIADVSNAWNFRKLVASPPNQHNNNSSDSPISNPEKSSPVVKQKQNVSPPVSTPGKDSSKDKDVKKDKNLTPPPPQVDIKEKNDNSTTKGDVKEKEKESQGKGGEKEKGEDKEEQKEKEKEKDEEKEEQKEEQKEKEKEKEEGKTDVPVGGGESCEAMESKCQDLKAMTACIKSVNHDSKALVLLIQNKGDKSLQVNITASSSGNKKKTVNIPKLQSQKVDMPLSNAFINEITLTAGNGYCVLHLGGVGAPVSQGNFFQWMPSYSKFMTPIYGAYLILAITFIAIGVWACCWFKKRKGHREVPYQELEMSRPESALPVETTEGWDEVWDDDWDEEKAVRSPGGGRSISANGLTSRNTKKDDWEEWDD